MGLSKPDESSLCGSGEKPELHRHAVKPDEWVRCCVYLQEQEKIGHNSCESVIFRCSVLRYRVRVRVSIMWP